MNKTKLVKLVTEEAAKLKKNASEKQLSNLDFSTLEPENYRFCIYGQMTGSCFSNDAHELITSCCSRMYKLIGNEFETSKLNGKTKTTMPIVSTLSRRDNHFSPIETFIGLEQNQNNGNNEILIDYLKGKTKTLKFNKF